MKILLVHNTYQQPGGEDVVFEQEHDLLVRKGHSVSTYRRTNWETERLVGIRGIQLAKNSIWSNDSANDIKRLVNESKPDVVHVHNTLAMISPSIYSACQKAGVPVVQTLHNYRLYCPSATFFRDGHLCEECKDRSLFRSVVHGCYRHSRPASAAVAFMLLSHRFLRTYEDKVTAYIALTKFARDKFIEAGLPADKVFCKPNFVYPDPGRQSPGEGNYALFVGRLSPEKRVSTLLHAWARLDGRIPLRIVGGGPELATLEGELTKLKLRNVTFEGQLPRDQTIEAMRSARFLVFSSEWYENFPVSLAESFACSLPVICSRLGAMKEIIEDGETGLHFTSGNAEDLAEKVTWAWNNPLAMRSMGEKARREFENKYTAEKNYPMLMRIYHHAMGREMPASVFEHCMQ